MSTGSSQRPQSLRPDSPVPVRWQSWPVGEGMIRAAGVVLALLAAWVLVRWLTGQVHLALLALAALATGLWRFFLPVTYELNTQGVEQSVLGWRRRIPWRSIGRYEVCTAGVMLLPHPDRCPIDVLTGLYLPWGSRREEVLAHVRYHLDPWMEG